MASLSVFKPPRNIVTSSQRVVYTLHAEMNTMYATRQPDPEGVRTSLVAFERQKDAALFGCMLEEHRRQTHEWPELIAREAYVLPMSTRTTLEWLTLESWKLKELEICAVTNCLDVFLLSSLEGAREEIVVSGRLLSLQATDPDFYRGRFDNLFYR